MSLSALHDDAVIQPRKGRNDPLLGPDVLMVAIGQDLMRLSKLETMDCFDQGFFKIFRRETGAGLSLAGPFLGAPQAAMVLEKIIALGAKRICLFGWCGSLQPDLNIGDLVIPLHALSEEGTSEHYPLGPKKPGTDQELNRTLEQALDQEGLPFRKGTVWTTDAPYRETLAKVAAYRDRGVLAVEMEMSALMTVAIYRSVKFSGLLVVSDGLSDLKWHRGFASPVFKKRCELTGKLLLELFD
ncbi:MAG: nucleoside phosphorylase [Desulfobacterota bacterium]|nr:nucleoside phosphorylase [Thermodesulfobacteriota bacterium]